MVKVEFATIEFDENEFMEKMNEAMQAMQHAQKKILEAQEAMKSFKIKGNCGILEQHTAV